MAPHMVGMPVGKVAGAQCELLDGVFAEAVQVGLAAAAIASLLLKRWLERPRRRWRVWLMDVSKQAASGLFVHVVNIVASLWLSVNLSATDPCAWYFVNFALDTTLGVALCYALLRAVERSSTACTTCTPLQASGAYARLLPSTEPVSPPPAKRRMSYTVWVAQLCAWLGIVGCAKATMLGMVYVLRLQFVALCGGMSTLFAGHRHLELVAVMIACPCLMNMAQFWVQDQFLKARASSGAGGGKDPASSSSSSSSSSLAAAGPSSSPIRSSTSGGSLRPTSNTSGGSLRPTSNTSGGSLRPTSNTSGGSSRPTSSTSGGSLRPTSSPSCPSSPASRDRRRSSSANSMHAPMLPSDRRQEVGDVV